jgi:nicotinate-nucleotide pyrophosphorylase (carboxylating)
MIKDNHYASLDLENLDLKILDKVKFIEFEVDDLGQLDKYLASFELIFEKVKGGILLDNFSSADLKVALEILNAKKRNFFIEASGGINLMNLSDYDLQGLDAVSTSDLFNFEKSLDLSAEIAF